MINRHPELRNEPYFWRKDKYKKSYGGYVMQIENFLKYCSDKDLEQVILNYKVKDLGEETVRLIAEQMAKNA